MKFVICILYYYDLYIALFLALHFLEMYKTGLKSADVLKMQC